MIIRVEHGWAIGYCSKGMRKFAEQHGLNWMDFLINGIDEVRLSQIDDHMVEQLIEAAHGWQEETNNRV